MRIRLQPGEKLIVEMADEDPISDVFAEFEIHNGTTDHPNSYVVKANFQPVVCENEEMTLYHAEWDEKTQDWTLKHPSLGKSVGMTGEWHIPTGYKIKDILTGKRLYLASMKAGDVFKYGTNKYEFVGRTPPSCQFPVTSAGEGCFGTSKAKVWFEVKCKANGNIFHFQDFDKAGKSAINNTGKKVDKIASLDLSED